MSDKSPHSAIINLTHEPPLFPEWRQNFFDQLRNATPEGFVTLPAAAIEFEDEDEAPTL